jgi:pimeloyl-ACP methyl ester carboxylesterase
MVLALAGVVAVAPAASDEASLPVEAVYAARGPHAIATSATTDGDGRAFELVFPADLAAGAPHPIVTWGNGSMAVPSQYEGLLEQLASWGMVVVASTTTEAGTGDEILAGARHLVAAHGDPASRFHGRLDVSHIAAVGHSQGAGGTVRAAVASEGMITTTVTVALPNRLWVTPLKRNEFEPSLLTGPALFLGGGEDQIISGPSTNRAYYDEVPGAAAVAVLTAADHNTIQGSGGGFLGYITAWLRYQLAGDATAATAFVGPDAELARNPAWQDQASKGLVAPAPSAQPSPVAPTATEPEAPPAPPATDTMPGTRARLPSSGGGAPLGLVVVLLAGWLATRRAAGANAA